MTQAEEGDTERRIRELDHRIKNDLQLIGSIFLLQGRRTTDEAVREFARDAQARVGAVAAVHRRLDVSGDPGRIEASAIVRDVAQDAATAARRGDVSLALELAPVFLPARQGAPLAIITGELVRNALTHAFPGRGGLIQVSLARREGSARLEVRDDGVGVGEAAEEFGLMLARLLAQQLRGSLTIVASDPGAHATLSFPITAPDEP